MPHVQLVLHLAQDYLSPTDISSTLHSLCKSCCCAMDCNSSLSNAVRPASFSELHSSSRYQCRIADIPKRAEKFDSDFSAKPLNTLEELKLALNEIYD